LDKEFEKFIQYQTSDEINKIKIEFQSYFEKIDFIKGNSFIYLINYKKIYESFNKEFEKFYELLSPYKGFEGLFGNKILMQRRYYGDIKRILLNKLTLDILKNQLDVKAFNKSIPDEIKYYLGPYIALITLINFRDQDEKRKIEANKRLIVRGLDMTHKGLSKEREEFYREIIIKNNEQRSKGKKSNFSNATRLVLKSKNKNVSEEKVKREYKTFNNFMNSNKLKSLMDFENYLSTMQGG